MSGTVDALVAMLLVELSQLELEAESLQRLVPQAGTHYRGRQYL